MNEPKKILIVRTDRIGDVVLTLPLASILKNKFPGTNISFLLRAYTKSLAENNININSVFTLIEEGGKPKITENVKQLKNKFDTAIIAYPTFRIALILFLAGIKTRIGSGFRWYSFFFSKKIYEHRKDSLFHELEYNVHLIKALGIDEKVNPENVRYDLTPSETSRNRVKEEFESRNVDLKKRLIIFHPGSGGSSIDLPFNSMKGLIEKSANELDVEILITGSSSEKELCQSLIVNKKTKNFAGLFELPELLAVIEKSDLMIANSTGPIHIAAALGKHVIGFYPKIITCSEQRWGPYTIKKKIFSPTINCSNCNKKQCEELDCMSSINIDQVFNTVKSFIEA
jgi:lipopolysaccharide heptosyltransferase II